jgi:hypothetical protein
VSIYFVLLYKYAYDYVHHALASLSLPCSLLILLALIIRAFRAETKRAPIRIGSFQGTGLLLLLYRIISAVIAISQESIVEN